MLRGRVPLASPLAYFEACPVPPWSSGRLKVICKTRKGRKVSCGKLSFLPEQARQTKNCDVRATGGHQVAMGCMRAISSTSTSSKAGVMHTRTNLNGAADEQGHHSLQSLPGARDFDLLFACIKRPGNSSVETSVFDSHPCLGKSSIYKPPRTCD